MILITYKNIDFLHKKCYYDYNKIGDIMNFEEAKIKKNELETLCQKASDVLKNINHNNEKTSLGLTPDHIKTSSAFKEAKIEYDKHFKNLREFNSYYVKAFKKEISNERKNKSIK